jgi:chaperonin cofactor prefoldin
MHTLPAPKPLTLLASTKGLEAIAREIKLFSENLAKQTAGVVKALKALQEAAKRTPYYLLHLVRESKKKALAWLTDRLDLLEAELLKAFTSKAKTAFRLSERIESLSKTFPTSSSVNP